MAHMPLILCFGGIIWVALWAAMVTNLRESLKHRKPGITSSLWLIYSPSKLTDEGARALKRYWIFGLCSVAWGALVLVSLVMVLP